MGLDCYIVHGNDHDKAFTSEDAEELKDVQLCGSMFTSGHGSDGSFRGKVYEPLIDDLMQHEGGIWHKSEDDAPPYVTSEELKEQAEALEELIREVIAEMEAPPSETYDDDTIIYQVDNWAEYTLGEVKDLATLLGVAGKRGAVMHVWW
tara:strand:+ start:388 stop:834 length:447 start_codon:yes stop_codon:yes gene_type:complete